MTNEEALNILYKGIASNTTANNECIELCKKALEKQIPKKPLHESLADRFCPVCGAYINFDALNESAEEAPEFCSGCGQALDWGDDI